MIGRSVSLLCVFQHPHAYAWILSPASFFARDLFLSFILFKISLDLKNNFKNFKLSIFIMLFIYLYVNIINMLLQVL